MNCPTCGHEIPDPDVIEVTPATVVDIFDVCLARPVGEYTAHLTVEIPVICVLETERAAPPKELTTEPRTEQPA